MKNSQLALDGAHSMAVVVAQSDLLRLKYTRANALISSVLNKYHNGSARAVDPFVIRCLQEHETHLFSIQCFLEQGPVEQTRASKESQAMKTTTKTAAQGSTFLSRLFGVCGAHFGAGSIMGRWDALSDAGYEEAMDEYICLVDKMLPGWDHTLDYPVTKQEQFWKDDADVEHCQFCGAHFSVQLRRHHCRMCLDIFCLHCCSSELEMALCPGAPVRKQRVCRTCMEEVEHDKSLGDIRRVLRANHEIEQQMKEIEATTQSLLAAKREQEQQLREQARQYSCDMEELEAIIQSKIGGPAAIAVKTPPAHKFTPRATVDANEQVMLANRQLVMGLKVAQCRAKKAIKKMDIILSVLRDAIACGQHANWDIVLGFVSSFLTWSDLQALVDVSQVMHRVLARHKLIDHCIVQQGVPSQERAVVWQTQCLTHGKTRMYVSDLAEAIHAQLDVSGSETDDSDSNDPVSATLSPSSLSWRSLVATNTTADNESPVVPMTLWRRVYELVLSRWQGSIIPLEQITQIERDVIRTFGISSLRPNQSKRYLLNGSDSNVLSIEARRVALRNVLGSFASVNTEIGYCQGMDYLTAMLLSIVDWHESNAFWLLTTMVASPRYELDSLYGPDVPDLALRCFQLEKLIERHQPTLHAYLTEIDFPVSVFATGWFMTLFTNMDALSYDVVVHVLDGFLIVGWKQLFRVALVILDALQSHILASFFEEIPQVFYNITRNAPQLKNVRHVLSRAIQFKVTRRMLHGFQDDYERSLPPSIPSRRSTAMSAATKLGDRESHRRASMPRFSPCSSPRSSSKSSTITSQETTTMNASPSSESVAATSTRNSERPSVSLKMIRSRGSTLDALDLAAQLQATDIQTPSPVRKHRSASSVGKSGKLNRQRHALSQKSPSDTRDASPLVSPDGTSSYDQAAPMASNYYF